MTRRHPEAVAPFVQPLGRGPNGRRLCRWCWAEVPKGKLRWCSPECVSEYLMENNWGVVRAAVYKRDRGVCSACGLDTELYRKMVIAASEVVSPAYGERDEFYKRFLGYANPMRDPWDADHVVARSEGGRDHPDNLRTLCVRCHKARTAEQARRWARERREAEASLFVGLQA
ncbi:MAG: HNH endonuclease [Planctomycetota bacterium]